MKLKKLFALALAVCMMALAVPAAFAASLTLDYGTTTTPVVEEYTPVVEVPTPVVYNTRTTSRASSNAVNTNGVTANKEIVDEIIDNDGNVTGYTVRLESWIEGSVTSTKSVAPLDIVLVLDQSSSMAYDFSGNETSTVANTRQYAMKQAVNNFIDTVEDKFEATKSDHRIAIVTFGDSAATLADWTYVNAAGETALINTITGLPDSPTADGTNTEAGLKQAESLLVTGYSYSGISTLNRQKLVILFTDGVPTAAEAGALNESIASNAIKSAERLKSSSVTVYSIGIFAGANPSQLNGDEFTWSFITSTPCDGSVGSSWGQYFITGIGQYLLGGDVYQWDIPAGNRFLNYISNNFRATELGLSYISVDNTGNHQRGWNITKNFERKASTYYKTAADASTLNNIFSEITENIESVSINLGSEAYLFDAISPYFVAPSNIKVMTATYNGTSFGADSPSSLSYELNNGREITVTGFDYAANFVSSKAHKDGTFGKKLIVEYDIYFDSSFFGGKDVPINTSGCALYDADGKEVESIAEYKVNVPIKYAVGVGTDQTIYLSNGVNLAGCLDFNKKDGTGIFAEGYVPDGTNNAFVNIKYIINGSIYTLPAGKKDFGNASYWSGSSTQVTENVLKGCTPYTITCNVVDAEDSTYVWSYEDSANIATATVHVLKPTVEAAETTTYISNTVSMPADTTEDNTVYDSHVTAWTDTTEGHAPAGVNVQPSVPDAAKLTWEFYDGETKVEQYTATNKECKELTAVLCINGNNYEKLYKNTYTVHVLTPNLKADSTKIYLGGDTNLYSRVSWKENWNNCTTHSNKTTANVPAGTEMPAADNVANCSFVDVSDPANYKNITCKALTAKWTSGDYTTSAQFDVHVLWPTISVADDTIYLGDTSKLTASISGWTCDKHEDVTANQPTTGEFDFYDENGVEVTDWTVSPHDCAKYTAKLVLADQPISKSFWVHVLTADVTVDDQVIYLSDSVTAKDATITWQNECDEHKCTVAAGEETLSDTVVFSEDGNTTSVDACGSYTAYLKVGNTVYKEEEFKDSFDVHVLEPQIKADRFAMYLSNNVNLNERQYITEWKCSDKTEENVTAGRVKPSVAYDFYQNIAGTAEENTSAYAPSEDVTLTVVVKVNSNEYSKKYQGTFAIDVLKPIFSVNQKEVWANYLSNVEVYTQYGNEVKSVDWDSTTYAIVGEEPGNISCTFELKKIAGDGDWDKTDATKYQTGTNEDTFKVVKATWTYADGKSFVATGDRVKCNDLYDFVIHTNKFQLTINADWSNSAGEQQGSIFTVSPVNQEDENLKPITVAIPKGVNSVVVTGLFSGQEYTIAEDNGWTWRYGTAAEAVGGPNIYCAGGFSLVDLAEKDDVTMSFDDGETYNAKWLADEDCVINKLNKNGVAVAMPVRTKEDYEEVTGA